MIEVINLKKHAQFENFEIENLQFAKLFRSKHVSISLDKYVVGVSTPFISKDRPQESKEILIPLEGILKIITTDSELTFDPAHDGISMAIIDGRTPRRFQNIGTVDARVLAIFAPPFSIEEINFLN